MKVGIIGILSFVVAFIIYYLIISSIAPFIRLSLDRGEILISVLLILGAWALGFIISLVILYGVVGIAILVSKMKDRLDK